MPNKIKLAKKWSATPAPERPSKTDLTAGKRRTNSDSEEGSDDQHAKKGADRDVSLDEEDVLSNKVDAKGQAQVDPQKSPNVRSKSPEMYREFERDRVRKSFHGKVREVTAEWVQADAVKGAKRKQMTNKYCNCTQEFPSVPRSS